ncbi:MAG: serine hydrolase, partial [Candidatus Latescibacteria bacterium]|nr:serine hydrolase [Candidatus Latescibacterota bacterium]
GGGGTDWDWNSDYWRNFGAPWGGLFTTASDLTTLCQAFLFGGEVNETRVLSKATVRSMTGDQTSVMPDLPESEKSRQRWGLGWRLSDVSLYSDLVSPDTFGHSGATGTVAWMDPTTEVTCVILTNDPTGARSVRPGVSDAVAAAVN